MRFRFNLNRKNGPASFIGKIANSLFFAVFFAMGCLFLWLLGSTVIENAKPYFWPTTPARILSSKIVSDKDSHQLDVRYEYSWQGQVYQSDRPSTEKLEYDHYDTAATALAKYAAGSEVTCRVDPRNPREAILEPQGLWIGLFLLIPLVFIGVGGIGIYSTWTADSATVSRPAVIDNKKVPWLFGGIFTLIGIGTFIALTIPMWSKAIASTQWIETPCVILSSGVKSHSGSKGTTYSVSIEYRYSFNGRDYRSDRYNPVPGSSSGYDGKKDIVNRYPQGSTQVCYVNPKNPQEALLKRGFSWGLLLGLFPLPFFVVGVAILISGLRAKSEAPRASTATFEPRAAPPQTGRLRAKESPFTRVFVMLFIALFWNGIVSVFLFEVFGGFQRGKPDWGLTLFMVPFVVVGLGLIGNVIWSALALANPRIQLSVENSEPLEPGGTLKVSWQMNGATRRLERLVIYLEGREEATYRRGTNTTTDTDVFFRQSLADVTGSWMDFQEGNGSLILPSHLMPSFETSHNRIAWSCKAWGKISNWPDVNEEFEITLNPPSRPT